MKPRLAVFDMVGTTVHAGDEVPAALRAAMAHVGVTLSDDAIAGVRGRSKLDAISDLLVRHLGGSGADPETVESVYARFQTALRAAYSAQARAISGAEETFAELLDAEIPIVLNTGLDRETAGLLLQALGWDRIGLLGMVTGDDVRQGRPAPDLIHAAMRLAGVEEPREVVAVGDTTSDLEAAAAAGVGWSVGVLSGAHARSRLEAHPHSVILASVADLPGWLKEDGAWPAGPGLPPS